MLVAEIIDQLQELKGEYIHLSRSFKEMYGDWGTENFLSDSWFDSVHSHTSFKTPNGEWYSLLTFTVDDEDKELATQYLKDNPAIEETFLQALDKISDQSFEVIIESIIKGQKILEDVSQALHKSGLSQVGMTTDGYLELEKVYYESSRCW